MRHRIPGGAGGSGGAAPRTGWAPSLKNAVQGDTLNLAAGRQPSSAIPMANICFDDWAWASPGEQHGVPYYPKAVIAVPFAPVTGTTAC